MNRIFTAKNLLFVLAVFAIVGVAFYFLWTSYKRPVRDDLTPVAQAVSVPVVSVKSKVLFRETQLPGEINAYQDVLVYPKVPGFIKWIGVDRGSIVTKNQPMVRMYAPEYLARRNESLAKLAAVRAELAAQESRLEDLKADLKKQKAKLLADQSTYQRVFAASLVPGVIADNDVVQWAQTVEESKQEVNRFIEKVNAKDHEVSMTREEVEAMTKAFQNFADFASYLEINAPFDGYVTDRKLHVGSFVGPDGTGAYPPICRVKQLDLLRIVAPVPEVDSAGVIVGSKVQFTVSAFPDKKFVGTVARISNDLDKNTRTMPVELNYFNPDFSVLPGMFCQVYWPTRKREPSLFVPISAVVTTPLSTFVCKVENDTVEWVPVRKGQIMEGLVEVFGNLKKGDLVAQQGSEALDNKSQVHPVLTDNSTPTSAPGQQVQPIAQPIQPSQPIKPAQP